MSPSANILLQCLHWSRTSKYAYSRRQWLSEAREWAEQIIGAGC